jgi:hypothetical protein
MVLEHLLSILQDNTQLVCLFHAGIITVYIRKFYEMILHNISTVASGCISLECRASACWSSAVSRQRDPVSLFELALYSGLRYELFITASLHCNSVLV